MLFSRKFLMQLTYYESENFSDSFLHHILEPESFKFPFLWKNSLTWGVKCEKLNLRKLLGHLLDKLRKLHTSGTVILKLLWFNFILGLNFIFFCFWVC